MEAARGGGNFFNSSTGGGAAGGTGEVVNQNPQGAAMFSPLDTQSRSGSSSESETDRSFDSDSSEGEAASTVGWARSSQAGAIAIGSDGGNFAVGTSPQESANSFCMPGIAAESSLLAPRSGGESAPETADGSLGTSSVQRTYGPDTSQGKNLPSSGPCGIALSNAQGQGASRASGGDTAVGNVAASASLGSVTFSSKTRNADGAHGSAGQSDASKAPSVQERRLLQHKKRQEKLNVKTLKLYSKIVYRMTKMSVILETAPCTSAAASSQQQQSPSVSGTSKPRKTMESSEIETKQSRKLAKLMAKYERDLSRLEKHLQSAKTQALTTGSLPVGLLRAIDSYIDPYRWIKVCVVEEHVKQNNDLRGVLYGVAHYTDLLRQRLESGLPGSIRPLQFAPLEESVAAALTASPAGSAVTSSRTSS